MPGVSIAQITNEIFEKKCDFYFVSAITEHIMGHLPVLCVTAFATITITIVKFFLN